MGALTLPRGDRGQSESGVSDLTDQAMVGASTDPDAPASGATLTESRPPEYPAEGDGCAA